MKKLFVMFAAATAIFAAQAETFNLEGPMAILNEEWRTGAMTGKNSCSGKINGKLYPDIYHFWCVESGVTPDTVKLAPLKAISPDSKGAKTWKGYEPILAYKIKPNGGFNFPALLKNSMCIVHTKLTYGMAYGVKNPFDSEVTCYVEGRLWHTEAAKIYVCKMDAAGKLTTLVEDNNPDAVENIMQTYRDGHKSNRHYMKLQVETRLQPGEFVVILGTRPDMNGKYVEKKGAGTFSIDGWGKAWNPICSFEK
jgi:hypothetical protein